MIIFAYHEVFDEAILLEASCCELHLWSCTCGAETRSALSTRIRRGTESHYPDVNWYCGHVTKTVSPHPPAPQSWAVRTILELLGGLGLSNILLSCIYSGTNLSLWHLGSLLDRPCLLDPFSRFYSSQIALWWWLYTTIYHTARYLLFSNKYMRLFATLLFVYYSVISLDGVLLTGY